MEPLDLSKRPPRSPRAKLDGLVMLPRTIDKMRALLPGGDIGPYKIDGLSVRLLNIIGVKPEDLQAAVSAASCEDEVSAWLRSTADVGEYEEANRILSHRSVADILPENLAWFEENYPAYKKILSGNIFEIIEADDAEMFSETPR